MRFKTPLLAASAAAAFCAGTSSAQLGPMDYAHHWAPNAETVNVVITGPALFSLGAVPNFASAGDAIRRCYGVDTTQGGRNRTGQWANTTFHIGQGYAPGGPGVDVGVVSVHGASESDLGGDVCFSPFLQSVGNTGGHQLVAAALIGVIGGTQGAPFPTVWDIVFQWVGTTVTFQGVEGNTTIGSAGAGPFAPYPLLTNVIYEVQGPLNGGPGNNQYYLASTTEVTGLGLTGPGLGAGYGGGTGGVTNGNVDWGSSLFGVPANVSGTVGHSRVIATDFSVGQTAFATTLFAVFNPVTPIEWMGYLGFQAPGLWAVNDLGQAQGPNEGAGGPDWRVSSQPTSVANLIYVNHLTGGQANSNVLFKAGLVGGPAAAQTALGAPPFGVNFPIFVYSATPAAGLQQRPLSWDDLGGAIPPQPNSIILGSFATLYGGSGSGAGGGPSSMGVSANFDAITNAFLGFAGLTFGTTQVPSDDIFLDGALNGTTSYFEGMFDNGYPGLVSPQNLISGSSGWSQGASPVPFAPNARGLRLGIAAAGLQVDGALNILVTEMSNALTSVFQ